MGLPSPFTGTLLESHASFYQCFKKIYVGVINQYIGCKKVAAPSPCYTPENKPTATQC